MEISIVKHKDYENKTVYAKEVHGKFPYKYYLEVRGNSRIGKHIVVVADKQLNNIKNIRLKDIDNINTSKNIIRPNTFLGTSISTYTVVEKSVLDIGNEPLNVYKLEGIIK